MGLDMASPLACRQGCQQADRHPSPPAQLPGAVWQQHKLLHTQPLPLLRRLLRGLPSWCGRPRQHQHRLWPVDRVCRCHLLACLSAEEATAWPDREDAAHGPVGTDDGGAV